MDLKMIDNDDQDDEVLPLEAMKKQERSEPLLKSR